MKVVNFPLGLSKTGIHSRCMMYMAAYHGHSHTVYMNSFFFKDDSYHLKRGYIEFKYYDDDIHSGLTPPVNNS